MTERDTVLTDFLLAAVAVGLAALSAQAPHSQTPAALFGALGVAALLGGFWHGWFSGQSRGGVGGALWLATLIAIGAANTALWIMAADLLAGWRGGLTLWAFAQLILFALIALLVTRGFWLASAFSLPPVLVLLAGFGHALWLGGPPGLWFGLAGLLLALAGAIGQLRRLALVRFGLGHNALYHLVQIVALILLALSLPAISDLLTKG